MHVARRLPSPALVIALVALFVSLGGTGYAVTKLGKNTVGSAQIRTNAVGASEVRSRAVGASEVKNGSLGADELTPAAVASLRGRAGATGPKGDKGDTGPSTGAAGGALAGSYPNPTIANGAVTPSKISGVPTVSLFATTATDVPNSANTPISFNGEEEDAFNMHDPGTPAALVAPIAGVYAITGEFTWDTNATGLRVIAVCPSSRARCVGDAELPATVTGVTDGTMDIATQVRLAAGESVVFNAFQNSGATRQVRVLSSPPETSVRGQMTWLAP